MQNECVAYEAPKALGDMFEAIIGAVYKDCDFDMSIVEQVFKPILAPLILYVAKLNREIGPIDAKERFMMMAALK